jgi:hypothetical protein
MAYNALCDEMGFECAVLLGERGGLKHAWNIARINGDYYHIDPSAYDVNGIEEAFLIGDAAMEQSQYVWDADKYPACEGPLTYADFYLDEPPQEDLE